MAFLQTYNDQGNILSSAVYTRKLLQLLSVGDTARDSQNCGPQHCRQEEEETCVLQIHPQHRLSPKQTKASNWHLQLPYPDLSSGLGPRLWIPMPVSDAPYILVLGLFPPPPTPTPNPHLLFASHCNSNTLQTPAPLSPTTPVALGWLLARKAAPGFHFQEHSPGLGITYHLGQSDT